MAAADGVAHPRELELLNRTADAFGISEAAYGRLKAVHLGLGDEDPFLVLGVSHDASIDEIRSVYRDLMREHHPDALMARGVPADMAKIAESRVAAINVAYERILSSAR